MIAFICEIKFKLSNEKSFRNWLNFAINSYFKEKSITKTNKHRLTYIFCDDKYLLSINQKHLGHDYYTDIITFDCSENNIFDADMFISIERVEENAKELHESFDKELKRVMIHGLLHVMGYQDKSEDEKKIMREKEDFYIALFEKTIN